MRAAAMMEVAASNHSWYAAESGILLSGFSRIAPPLPKSRDHDARKTTRRATASLIKG